MSTDKTNQSWGGRFSEPVDAFVARFTASVTFDQRLYRHDIMGSVAHATMLAKVGVLTDAERDSIIDGLKTIQSEIEAGTFDFTYGDVNVNLLCENIVRSMEMKVSEGVALVFDSNLPQYHLISDRNRLHQVISNFVNNAIKFTSQGSIRVGYQMKGEELEFYVQDTGIGIDKEQQLHIFERFVKLNSFVPGTGLGLAICQSIIEQLGGRIGVDSEPGKGSRFWFRLPG